MPQPFDDIEAIAQSGLEGDRDGMTEALSLIQLRAREAREAEGTFVVPEDALRQIGRAINEERQHFAELGIQALAALSCEEDEWARVLLLTIRAQGLGGPLEPMFGELD